MQKISEDKIQKMEERIGNDEIRTDIHGGAFWNSSGIYLSADDVKILDCTGFLFSPEETARAREAQEVQKERALKEAGHTKNKAQYNRYEFKLLNKETKKVYLAWEYGRTVEEAVQHNSFWEAPGQRIGELFEIIGTKIESTTDKYPYEAEDLLKKAFAEKEETLKKLELGRANPQDKEDLRAVIENEAPWDFWPLDTLCRDRLFEIMK